MKRLLSSFLFVLLSFSATKISAQAFNFSITPQILCFNASGTNTALIAVTATQAAAGSYTWVIQSPTCGIATQTNVVPNGSIVVISYPCCGDYTITGYPYAAISPTTPIGSPVTYTGTAVCPTSASINLSSPTNTVCAIQNLTLTASGVTTFTWISSAGGGGTTTTGVNPLVVTPTANTTYTMTGLTAQGCSVTTTRSIFVQSATLSAIPASQSVCPTSPLCFTTTAGAITGTNVTAGTTTTGIQWYNPSAVAVPGCTSAAAFGTYTAVLTHTGAAGSCTLSATAQVFTISTIPVALTASSPSICPNGTVLLTATSAQTSAVTGHNWVQSAGGPIFSTGNPITRTVATLPRDFTVNVNYFGCPGQATITIGLLTLTPTLTPTSFSVCPNRSLTLNATGGVNYTIIAVSGTGASLTIGTGTTGTAIHTPSAGGFLPAWNYVVNTTSTGCVGSNTIAVNILTIQPLIVPSSTSVCPNTNFTLTSSGGSGTNYTFTAPPSSVIQTGSVNFVVQNVPTPTLFPRTYTVAVDSAGCNGSSTFTVHLLNLNPQVALSTPSVCEGTSFSFTSSGGAGTTYTFFAPTFTNPGTSSVVAKADVTLNTTSHIPVFSPTLNTTYTVQVDSAGCKGSNTFSVGILNLSPNIGLLMIDATDTLYSACPNSTFALNAYVGLNPSNFTYTFTTPSPPISTSTGITPSLSVVAPAASNLFPSTYTVTVDSSGCIGTKTVSLALRILNRGVIAGSASVCAGTSVIVCSIPGNSLTLYSFISQSAAGTNSTVPSTAPCFTFNPTQATVYSVLADSSGCNNIGAPIQTVVVGMTPSLNIAALSSPSIICSGLPSTLSVVGSTAYTYTWTAPSGTNSIPIGTGTTTVVNPTVNTNYTVNALDAAGCIGTATVNLVIDPTASLSMNIAAPFNTICPGQSNTLTASGAVNYQWTPTLSLSSPNTFSTITTPTTTMVYTVNGNNGLGCNGSSQFTVTVNAYPQPTIVPTAANVCPGFTSTLTAFGAQSYTWSGTTFTGSIIQQSISVGPGTYTVFTSNGGSCSGPPTFSTIGVAPPLVITSAQTTQTTCIIQNNPKLSKAVHLTAFGAASYVWFPYDPATMTYSLGPQTDVRPHSSTCYTITGNTSVCSGSAVVCVTVVPQFTIGVTPPLPAMCLGDSLKLSIVNIGLGAVGSPAAFTYSWTEAQNAPPLSMSAYLSPTTMVFPQNTTTYSVDVADTRSCVSLPRLITVTVLPRPVTNVALPIINNVPTNTVCFVGPNPGPSDIVLNLSAINANSGLPFGIVPSYTWISPYSPSSILTPPNLAMITVSAPKRLPSVVVYTVVSGYNGVQGCRREDTVSVRVIDCRPITVVTFTTAVEKDTMCARDCITFMNLTDTTAGGPQKLSWSFPGGSPATSTLANPTICYNLPGQYNVILKVENPYPKPGGSSGQNGKLNFIIVLDKPNVTIEPPGQLSSDRYIRFGESTDLSGSGAMSYIWDPVYNISSATASDVKVSPLQTTQYVLWGYNSKNCFSSDTINVIVKKDDCGEMYVPNAFSPNNDGHNDVIKVQGICLETMTFMIFNRWGEKVFESTNQNDGWDGTFKGKEMETGVYAYRLEGKKFDGTGHESKGNITLIR